MLITLIVLAVLLVIDIITKYLAQVLITPGKTVTLIPHILDGTLVYNKGAAWSFLSDATWLLMIVSLIATGVLIYFSTKNNWKNKKCYSTAITLMLAGTFGNFVDRFFSVLHLQEGVVDMIILKPLDSLWELMFKSGFPIFNFADVCLVIGIVVLAIDMIFFQETRKVK